MNLYIDDSYFPTSTSCTRQNASVLAGILFSKDTGKTISLIMDDTKCSYGIKGLPIKYTSEKRLRDSYKNLNRLQDYQTFERKRHLIIKEIVKRTVGLPYHILFKWDVIDSKALTEKQFNQVKWENTANCITSLLDFSLEYFSNKLEDDWNLVLDHFEKNQQKQITNQVAQWKERRRLKNLPIPFNSLHYGVTCQDNLLQFNDIIVGILRDLIQSSIKGKEITSPNCAQILPKVLGYQCELAKLKENNDSHLHNRIFEVMVNTTTYTKHFPPLFE